MKHRFSENAEVISVDAIAKGFHATVSGDAAFGTIFIPCSTADMDEKLKLRINLPGGVGVVKATGRVAQIRKHGVPGCIVAWYAKGKGAEAVISWLKGRS